MKEVPIIYVSIIQIRYKIYYSTAQLMLNDDFEISSFKSFWQQVHIFALQNTKHKYNSSQV